MPAPQQACQQARARLAARHAVEGWRLGRLRRRQQLGISSATFPSPITTPCSIPPARISPAACSKRWRRTDSIATTQPSRAAWITWCATSEPDGSWYGRWGVAYIYGTCFALRGLAASGESDREAHVLRAGEWLRSIQNADGGWGESCASYDNGIFTAGPSTPSQTAWAILGLIAGGDTTSLSVQHGIEYLLETQRPDGSWDEELATGTGFPKVFYLNYHLYKDYFPLLALSSFVKARANSNG